MTPTFETLTDAIEQAGYSAFSYSGVAMFGKHCVAVYLEHEHVNLWDMAVRMGMNGHGSIPAPKVEGAGPGALIASWPTVEWEGEPVTLDTER